MFQLSVRLVSGKTVDMNYDTRLEAAKALRLIANMERSAIVNCFFYLDNVAGFELKNKACGFTVGFAFIKSL